MKPRITLVTLGVDDLERAVRFYRDGLGFATQGVVGTQFEYGAVAFFDLQAGLKLALWPRASIARDAGIAVGSPSPTELTLGHNVGSKGDVDAVMDQAAAAGALVVKPARDTFWGGYAGYFQDPDGHLWEVAWNPQWVVPQSGVPQQPTASTSVGGQGMEGVEARSDSRHKLIQASPAEVYAAIGDPVRMARWWGPQGFSNTIHEFQFHPGGRWLLTMHGPDGKDYPNESRFVRIVPDRSVEIEHLSGHHFLLRIDLTEQGAGTIVFWQQTFDTVEHYERIAGFVATANEQNLDRLAEEVQQTKDAA